MLNDSAGVVGRGDSEAAALADLASLFANPPLWTPQDVDHAPAGWQV